MLREYQHCALVSYRWLSRRLATRERERDRERQRERKRERERYIDIDREGGGAGCWVLGGISAVTFVIVRSRRVCCDQL